MDTISVSPAPRLLKKKTKQKERDVDVYAALSSADQMCFKVFPALMKN